MVRDFRCATGGQKNQGSLPDNQSIDDCSLQSFFCTVVGSGICCSYGLSTNGTDLFQSPTAPADLSHPFIRLS